jgi:hypothetical protein
MVGALGTLGGLGLDTGLAGFVALVLALAFAAFAALVLAAFVLAATPAATTAAAAALAAAFTFALAFVALTRFARLTGGAGRLGLFLLDLFLVDLLDVIVFLGLFDQRSILGACAGGGPAASTDMRAPSTSPSDTTSTSTP